MKETNQEQKGASAMSNNPYLYEKLVAIRHAEIRHAMQRSHRPVRSAKSPTLVENAADKFGTWLVELGSRLQRTNHQREASLS
jgi:hypothetical protein